MFVQSYTESSDMKISVKNYLLRYLPYAYSYEGHLHYFTQYENNYTFLVASSLHKSEEQSKGHDKTNYDVTLNNPLEDDKNDNQLKYIYINWNQSYPEVLDDIGKKFKIDEECNSIITFYLTFPSYPENNSLLNFFKNFKNNLNKRSYSSPLNNDQNMDYRQDIDPSFLSIVDELPLVIFQQLLRQHRNVRLVLCGHGLGGAIAQLSTLHLLSKEIDLECIQLRSISIGSLFFAKELTVNFIKNHHLEKHFINIYHEMDAIPSLFNTAEILSKLIHASDQKTKTINEYIWSRILSFFFVSGNPIETHRFYLKHVLTWICRSLTSKYSALTPQMCDSVVIDTSLQYLKKSFDYTQHFLHKDSLPKLIYQPIGIYNMITFRNYDQTWHLINVINPIALNGHLNKTLQSLSASEQIFENHFISTYITDLQQCNKQRSEFKKIQTISKLVSSFQSDEDTSVSHSNSIYSIIIPLPFRFSNNLYNQFRSGASYMSMISVPPVYRSDNLTSSISRLSDLNRKFLSAIKHRTGLSNINLNNKKDNKKQKLSNMTSIYDICLNVYNTYGMDARMELMKLQLDQRMLVPILVSNHKDGYSPFRSYIKTLSLVETAVLQSQENLLAPDLRLLRIGLISTIQEKTGGLPDFIENIFHTLSIRQPISGIGQGISAKTIAETGYGFLPDSKSPLSYQPVILMHIIGDYRPLVSFLAQYVDALIVEYNGYNKNFADFDYHELFESLRIRRIMKWKHTTDAEFDEINHLDVPYAMDEFEGSVKAVTSAFQKYLLEISYSNSYLDLSTSHRPRLVDIIEDKNLFTDDDTPMFDMETLFKDINTGYLKKELFQLQRSYKKEAENQLNIDNPKLQLNDNRRKQLEENIRRERIIRSIVHENVSQISLLKSFISLTSEINDEKRYIEKRQFEFTLSKYNEKTLSIIRQEKDETFIKMTKITEDLLMKNEDDTYFFDLKTKQKEAIDRHYIAKQEFIDTSLTMDHFWRETSHLFVTNKTLYGTYPDFAAQHLIDGFSLEILDGDSMLLNMQWLEYVFDSLNKKLYKELNHPARILVLSICGPQSSGKSFLLKTMYGIRIRSSVGACTQGVNMMLVKVVQQDYDYVLLLDTEGIRAPEFMNLPGSEIRDNTLTAFAVLPADGTILLNKGEVNQALEEVLPIVLYLYATSSLSMQLGGQIPSKLFFIYNQIDTSQSQKGMEILQDLTTRLHNATNKIRQSMSLTNTSFHGFEHCRLDLNNLSNSDFRILPSNTNNPPINHPVYLFGEQVLQLRQWIDQRITETHKWKARSISDILEYFKVVSDIIRQSPHITSVSTALEMLANNKLNRQIETIKYIISSNFTTIRTQIENDIIRNYTISPETFHFSTLSSSTIENMTDTGYNILLNIMQETILNAQNDVFKLIKDTKRESSLTDDWNWFLDEKRIRNRKLLSIKIEFEITNAHFIIYVEEKIRQDFINKCNEINCANLTNHEQIEFFNHTLQNRVNEFQQPHHSRIINVRDDIKKIFNRSTIIDDVKIFDDKKFCHENGSFQRMINKDNQLKHIQKSQSNEERLTYINRFTQETQKFDEAIDQIKSYINILIGNGNRYDPFIVNEVLVRIRQIIHERSIISTDTKKDIYRGTFCFLEYQLIQLQDKWDFEHDRTKRLEENRENLFNFYQNVVQGIRGIKLFQLELYNQLETSWKTGFIENLIRDVKNEVTKQPWIGNSDIFSAYIDNEKIQILEEHGIIKLLDQLKSASSFYEKSLNKFVQVHVDNYVENRWTIFYNNLLGVIIKAGYEAKNSPKDCLKLFLQTIRDQNLPFSIISRLPDTADTYGNVDDQPRNIFDNVVEKLQSAIPQQPNSLLKGDESQEILNQLRHDAPTDYVKPRCNHACKMCGAPCFRHSNHSGHHNFHHQPAGLAGISKVNTEFIVHETCHESLIRNSYFSLDEGSSIHQYTDFPQIFGYEIPYAQGRRSPLGEYLISKYHNEIASYYHIKPNPLVPVTYMQHTLEDVKETIRKLMYPMT